MKITLDLDTWTPSALKLLYEAFIEAGETGGFVEEDGRPHTDVAEAIMRYHNDIAG